MDRKTFEEIYNLISPNAIAHIKTTTGDKLCIKDNKNTAKTGISCTMHDLFIEVKCISIAEKVKKTQVTLLPYTNILMIEFAVNDKTAAEANEGE